MQRLETNTVPSGAIQAQRLRAASAGAGESMADRGPGSSARLALNRQARHGEGCAQIPHAGVEARQHLRFVWLP